MKPGENALARIPEAAPSVASCCVRPLTPALAAACAEKPIPTAPTMPTTDAMLMIDPRARVCGHQLVPTDGCGALLAAGAHSVSLAAPFARLMRAWDALHYPEPACRSAGDGETHAPYFSVSDAAITPAYLCSWSNSDWFRP